MPGIKIRSRIRIKDFPDTFCCICCLVGDIICSRFLFSNFRYCYFFCRHFIRNRFNFRNGLFFRNRFNFGNDLFFRNGLNLRNCFFFNFLFRRYFCFRGSRIIWLTSNNGCRFFFCGCIDTRSSCGYDSCRRHSRHRLFRLDRYGSGHHRSCCFLFRLCCHRNFFGSFLYDLIQHNLLRRTGHFGFVWKLSFLFAFLLFQVSRSHTCAPGRFPESKPGDRHLPKQDHFIVETEPDTIQPRRTAPQQGLAGAHQQGHQEHTYYKCCGEYAMGDGNIE